MREKWRNSSKLKKTFIIIGGVIAALLISVFMFVRLNTYQPLPEATALLDEAHVEETDDWLKLSTDLTEARLVFYPGGLVEPVSYLPLFEPLTNEGYEIYIMKMPFNLAILNTDAIEELETTISDDVPTYLSGHSLGGASAALYLAEEPEAVDGLVFLAAYPAGGSDLSEVDFPVVSITAQHDGVLDWVTFETNQSLLPKATTYSVIEGGNHANFGSYGKQEGDGESTISREEQQTITRRIFTDLIDK
ncbi:Alpha/beta hydrolase family protein [Halolactibacillus halophilus]|uniref:Alpha/beta hydrolase family protein n=1 Tax=Halolactibacillus halophilus TaxID=306540 RepID=A0A1I5RKS6_9BACI|nr:alpha/beta hydrolase [Halolactibacillus halophilus]GEM02469.1 carboxymethylenebutenolidase [Halolactibacillus halophilus]SFP58871.1 Alpha/beta hydrolase family protein [Halolactibacillus halophilus]